MPTHEVSQGECISSIAAQYGFFWETVWKDAENTELRASRPNPNTLLPGDVVVIPEKKIKEESCAAEQLHKFKRKGVPAVLKIKLMNNGEVRKDVGWKASLGGKWQEGKTGTDGMVEIKLEPRCEAGILRLEDGTEYRLLLRELDPIETVSGVQARLNNLGYECGAVNGQERPEMKEAIKWFKKDYQLKEDGEMNEEMRGKLKEVYGC